MLRGSGEDHDMSYLDSTFSLKGKRAVVTGASRGIGKAIAEALAAAGANVLVHYNKNKDAAAAIVTSNEESGGKAWSAGADLTDVAQVRRLFDLVSKRWDGALDILVNNAGDMFGRTPLAEQTDEWIERVLKINLHSALYATRSAIPLLRHGNAPCIVNLSSVAAHNGGAGGVSIYAAAKGAIHTLTRALAKELAPQIRVNAIAPGVILTDLHHAHSTPQKMEDFKRATPLGRVGSPEECAAPVVFLCSNAASFITGEVIEINGGIWMA
jgi:3-oxoacyl-[acyl-carrier protein] reductase